MRRLQTSRQRRLPTAGGGVIRPLRCARSVAAENDRPTVRKMRGSCHAGVFGREEPARSASNTWFSGGLARKSLIVERTTATSHVPFAISHVFFAMCLVLSSAAPPLISSLSNSLKKKKKESEEDEESGQTARHVSASFCHHSQTPPIFWAMSSLALPAVIDGNR